MNDAYEYLGPYLQVECPVVIATARRRGCGLSGCRYESNAPPAYRFCSACGRPVAEQEVAGHKLLFEADLPKGIDKELRVARVAESGTRSHPRLYFVPDLWCGPAAALRDRLDRWQIPRGFIPQFGLTQLDEWAIKVETEWFAKTFRPQIDVLTAWTEAGAKSPHQPQVARAVVRWGLLIWYR